MQNVDVVDESQYRDAVPVAQAPKTEEVDTGTLESIYQGNTVTLLDGTVITISKMKVKFVKPALLLIKKLMQDVKEMEKAKKPPTPDLTLEAVVPVVPPSSLLESIGMDKDDLLQLIADNYDSIYDLLAAHIAVGKDALGEMDIEDGTRIAIGVARINRDFFTQAVLRLAVQLEAENG